MNIFWKTLDDNSVGINVLAYSSQDACWLVNNLSIARLWFVVRGTRQQIDQALIDFGSDIKRQERRTGAFIVVDFYHPFFVILQFLTILTDSLTRQTFGARHLDWAYLRVPSPYRTLLSLGVPVFTTVNLY